MAAPYVLPHRKVEDAVAGLISANVTSEQLNGATVTKGRVASDISVPAVHVIADNCEPSPAEYVGYAAPSGNWMVTCRVRIVSHGEDEDRDAHDTRAGYILDKLHTADLTGDLNAINVTDCDIYRAWVAGIGDSVDGNWIVTEVTLQIEMSNL